MEYNAQMNAMMNETLNIGGVLLVKLFGRTWTEVERFSARAKDVRDVGIKRAVVGSQFFVMLGMVGVIGTALVYWVGGHLVLDGVFTIGTIVAFSAYLTQLYGALQGLTNAPVAFATSMVSFERVFEVLDLPLEIAEQPDAIALEDARGDIVFEDVTFLYHIDQRMLLGDVKRYGQMEAVSAALSGRATRPRTASLKGRPRPAMTRRMPTARRAKWRSITCPSTSRRGSSWRWSAPAARARRP